MSNGAGETSVGGDVAGGTDGGAETSENAITITRAIVGRGSYSSSPYLE